MSDTLTRITTLLGDLEEDELLETVDQSLSAGDDPLAVVEACRNGMEIVGKRFSEEEYFVSELICSAELFQSVMEKVTPLLSASDDQGPKTKVVIGTVKDDIHDIGKDIVIAMLRCSGYEVYDLGINVPPEEFVNKVKETDAKIVGMSGLLTIAFSSMEETIKALKDAGLNVKTMIGGGMTNDLVCEKVGADGWGRDAMEAVNMVKSFSEVS
ncbi:MAG: cobalamin-dependent protein [Dehalococcoidales bacterium]|nr:cobalamin-dependent protein [Dehalococcoidales bacterium]